MIAAHSSAGVSPLNHSFSSLRINPLMPTPSPHSYCKSFLCKNSHKNSVAFGANSLAERVLVDIQNSGVIACLRAPSAGVAIEAARAALRGGVTVLEITMSSPGVFEALRCLVEEYPSASLGVGTVLDRGTAKDALKFGAKFLMSPAMVKGILDDVADSQALYIPGAMTPTEILSASDAGARIIKVYPVSALGGVEYIAAVKKPFPHIPMVASQGITLGEKDKIFWLLFHPFLREKTGQKTKPFPHIPMVASQGITLDSLGQYIAQGASSVVLSDAIFDKKAMAEGNFVVINQLASLAAIKGSEAVRKTRERLS